METIEITNNQIVKIAITDLVWKEDGNRLPHLNHPPKTSYNLYFDHIDWEGQKEYIEETSKDQNLTDFNKAAAETSKHELETLTAMKVVSYNYNITVIPTKTIVKNVEYYLDADKEISHFVIETIEGDEITVNSVIEMTSMVEMNDGRYDRNLLNRRYLKYSKNYPWDNFVDMYGEDRDIFNENEDLTDHGEIRWAQEQEEFIDEWHTSNILEFFNEVINHEIELKSYSEELYFNEIGKKIEE